MPRKLFEVKSLTTLEGAAKSNGAASAPAAGWLLPSALPDSFGSASSGAISSGTGPGAWTGGGISSTWGPHTRTFGFGGHRMWLMTLSHVSSVLPYSHRQRLGWGEYVLC